MGNKSLWPEIDHAEKCLVSSMYEEAAELASSTLRILLREGWDEINRSSLTKDESSFEQYDENAEAAAMVEAAGMVLLQAVSQMDRHPNTLNEMISVFDGLNKVPYSLILTSTCLQLSKGFDPTAQIAIEEYLSGWRVLDDGLMVKVGDLPVGKTFDDKFSMEDPEEASCTVHLSRTKYLQLVEIYAVEVLAKLRKNFAAANLWIQQNACLSEENKQVIFQRLQQLSQKQSRKPIPRSSRTKQQRSEITTTGVVTEPVQRMREERGGAGSLQQQEASTRSIDYSQVTRVQSPPPMAPEYSKSRIMTGYGIWRFPFVRTVSRLAELLMIRLSATSGFRWIATRRRLPNSKVLVLGAFTSIVIYALVRKRQVLRKRMEEIANLASVCFSDLYKLAFTVHLSPLASV